MKNLIVNIYKTLFFFDFAIVLIFLLPDIKAKKLAWFNFWQEMIFFAVMILFTVFFIHIVERKKLKVFNFKNVLRHYSLGLLTAIIPLGVAILIMWVFKLLSFKGVNKTSDILLWLISVLLNTIATELLLRGYLFKLYRKFYNIIAVTIVITLLYISLNINIFSIGYIYAANMLVMNILLCLLAEYSYSLLAPITAHFVYNAVSGLVFGSLNLGENYPVILKVLFGGNKKLSGGENGFEGSVIMLLCSVALCVYFGFKLYKREKNKTVG